MGRESRTRGHNFEREIARELTEATGIKHERVLTEYRQGEGIDVRPAKASGFPVVIQCKYGKRPDIYGAIRDVVAGAESHEFAVVASHRTGQGGERLAVLPWSDFLEILGRFAEDYR